MAGTDRERRFFSTPAWQRSGRNAAPLARYTAAIALTLLVIAARYALNPWWGQRHNRHLVFLPTVMLVAWFGGFRAGLLSMAISTIALDVLWSDAPAGDWHAPSVDLWLFAMLAVVICAVIGSLQRARAAADAATRSRQRVLEIVAHDLRSPLTAIRTTADAIARAAPEMRPRVSRIDRSVTRMDDLIRDLLDVTRLEHGQLNVTVAPEPADAIVREILELHAGVAQERGVALEGHGLDEHPGLLLPCDRGRIVQALSNLVGNALRFTPPGGRITIAMRMSAAPAGRILELSVADTGTGIAPEHLSHVFEPYWRSDEKGTGLGLYIASSIVRAHGGEIAVNSAPGSGATFTIKLPAALALISPAPPPPPAA